MQELKVRVSTGRYSPIPSGRYSSELIGFCHGLLTVDPKKRPSPDSILMSTAASKWLKVLPTPPPAQRWSDNGGPSSAGALPGKLERPHQRANIALLAFLTIMQGQCY